MATVVEVRDLRKTFRPGLLRRSVHALRGVSFEVREGEVFGLVGPNGAGKTTTLKALMGLIFPSAGSARLFSRPAGDPEAKRRVGFLPENPYFYEYLTGRELCDLVARLFGLPRAERRRRAGDLLERVGLGEAADRPLGRYSKGMLQRIGLAQALIGDPALVVLDEPMSGLDPIGRRQVRDLIAELRRQGRTVLFSTHILPDVEMLCDRVAILAAGQVRDVGEPDRMVSARLLSTEVVLEGGGDDLVALAGRHGAVARAGGRIEVSLAGPPDDLLREAIAAGARVVSVTPRRETLEQVFVRHAAGAAPRGEGAA